MNSFALVLRRYRMFLLHSSKTNAQTITSNEETNVTRMKIRFVTVSYNIITAYIRSFLIPITLGITCNVAPHPSQQIQISTLITNPSIKLKHHQTFAHITPSYPHRHRQYRPHNPIPQDAPPETTRNLASLSFYFASY